MSFHEGDQITADWQDGLILTGTYVGLERGFTILRSSDGQRLVCGPTVILTKTEPDTQKITTEK